MTHIEGNKKIAILGFLDGFGNSYRPKIIKEYLEKQGCDVVLINTIHIHKLSSYNGNVRYRKFTDLSIYNILLHAVERLMWVKNYKLLGLKYYLLIAQMHLRGKILSKVLSKLMLNLVIVENALDSFVILEEHKYKILYDCPTPFADELLYGNDIDTNQYKSLVKLEIETYKKVDYLTFHGEAYYSYVKKYLYKGKNMLYLKAGCSIQKMSATYDSRPKIVYIGGLGGYWVNMPLLSKLSQLYPIDVYGLPAPDPKYKLNYKGYAKSAVLSKYQFGLITLSKDRLRREGFSAKHTDYLSYGLPVFMPEWRPSAKLVKGTILYNENNFLKQIEFYSKKDQWEELYNLVMHEAKQRNWSIALEPLKHILTNI